jgi:hypothetical protein
MSDQKKTKEEIYLQALQLKARAQNVENLQAAIKKTYTEQEQRTIVKMAGWIKTIKLMKLGGYEFSQEYMPMTEADLIVHAMNESPPKDDTKEEAYWTN